MEGDKGTDRQIDGKTDRYKVRERARKSKVAYILFLHKSTQFLMQRLELQNTVSHCCIQIYIYIFDYGYQGGHSLVVQQM